MYISSLTFRLIILINWGWYTSKLSAKIEFHLFRRTENKIGGPPSDENYEVSSEHIPVNLNVYIVVSDAVP
jgi:hypothetical protein